MQNFQGIVLLWVRTYREIFKSALLYPQKFRKIHRKTPVTESLFY